MHYAWYASHAQRLRSHPWHGLPMNTTRELAHIIAAADQLPEPARTAARAELWQVQRHSPAAQAAAVARWHEAMRTWPTAGDPAWRAAAGGTLVARPEMRNRPRPLFLQVTGGFLLVAGAGFEPATSGL